MRADPVFHLTHGLSDFEVRVPFEGGEFVRSITGIPPDESSNRRLTPT